MKLLATVGNVVLIFLALITKVMDGMCHIFAIEKPILIFEPKDTSDIKPDTAIAEYQIDNIRGILENILPLFFLQIADAATSDDQLKFLFQVFPSSRLQPDTALLEKIICTAASGQSILSLNEIKAFNIEDSTQTWFIQAVGAFTGKPWVKMLCHLTNVSDASAIELQGHLVEKDVYATAAVADTVASSDQPAQVITALDNPLVPVSKVALVFVVPKQIAAGNYIPNDTEKLWEVWWVENFLSLGSKACGSFSSLWKRFLQTSFSRRGPFVIY